MKQHPQTLSITDFNYALPETRIAKYPLTDRSASKLLLYRNGKVSEDRFSNITGYLPEGTLMVFNNTKVIQARLHFNKATGALIEIFCLEPHTPHDYQQNFSTKRSVIWTCLIGNLKKWKEGKLERDIQINGRQVSLLAERRGASGTGHEVCFEWNDEQLTFSEILEACGELPIPPYLNRETEEQDLQTYQTVYSKVKGSVAAPTAGLHFTDDILAELDAKGIERSEITLHVGAGTFKPVKSEHIAGHTMHSEWIAVRRESIEALLRHGGHCIAVGTTSVRTLESLYYLGVHLSIHPETTPDTLHVAQWAPYETSTTLSATEALTVLLEWLDTHKLPVLHASTQIIIAPGYDFHIVKTIITNFHQPQSTLLLLVSAFVQGDWRTIYDYALAHNFRFLSYGDSSLLNY